MFILLQSAVYCFLTAFLLEIPTCSIMTDSESMPLASILNLDIKHDDDTTIQAELLLTYIQIEQLRLVSKSNGGYARQCFTDNNLSVFISDKTANQAVEHLKNDHTFSQKVLPLLLDLPLSNWLELKKKALQTRRPTWAEQGDINENGTTEAGAKAESLIAETITIWIEEQR